MKDGPDIARIAALVGDPARANMLTALVGGLALTAGELAREAAVTPATASSHLAKLQDGGLIIQQKQGRHRYFRLSGPDVADVLERLMGLAARAGHARTRPGPKEPAMRRARVCYDHLAGDLGVAVADAALERGLVSDEAGLAVTGTGVDWLAGLGIDVGAMPRSRPALRSCLDWTVRRPHLAGAVGAALCRRSFELGWVQRIGTGRALRVTPDGAGALRELLGVTVTPGSAGGGAAEIR